MFRKLKNRAAELIMDIHNIYLLSPMGAKEALLDEIRRALDLRRGWSLEEYEHSETILKELEKKVWQYRHRKIKGNHDLTNAIMTLIRLSKATEEEKMLSLSEVLEYQAAIMTPKKVAEQPQNLANYLANLLREPDGHYPPWLVGLLSAHIKSTLNNEDVEALIKDLQKVRNDRAFLEMFFRANEELDAKEREENKKLAMDIG